MTTQSVDEIAAKLRQAKIPEAQYKAMRRICDPMFNAAFKMTGEEIALAMQGFYATSETNCPWYAFALRHVLPSMLATIGSDRDGYQEAFMSASARLLQQERSA